MSPLSAYTKANIEGVVDTVGVIHGDTKAPPKLDKQNLFEFDKASLGSFELKKVLHRQM